jgi:putative tryptophan/tyrosine transport system substrate-binding protein
MIGRREFITLFGGAAAVWPIAARAQQPAMPVVGFLSGISAGERPHLVDSFRRGLSEVGYLAGQNVAIEYRYAENQPDRLRALAADLIDRRVAVIAATGGNNPALVAKSLTTTIPIVFTSGVDPVRAGLVNSFSQPEGNVTGVSWFSVELGAKHRKVGRQKRAMVMLPQHRLLPQGSLRGLGAAGHGSLAFWERGAQNRGKERHLIDARRHLSDKLFQAIVQ